MQMHGSQKEKQMKKWILLLLSVWMLTACGTMGNSNSGYRQISMDEAVAMMEQESGYRILDVRRPDEFAAGHIPNAINVPNESIGEGEIAALPTSLQHGHGEMSRMRGHALSIT